MPNVTPSKSLAALPITSKSVESAAPMRGDFADCGIAVVSEVEDSLCASVGNPAGSAAEGS